MTDTRFGGRQPSPGQAGCTTCNKIFSSVRAFDQHRDRRDDPSFVTERDRCIDPASLGMTEDGTGVWHMPVSERDRERMASLRSRPAPQSDETPNADVPGSEQP